MKSSQVKQAVKACVAARRPLLIHGSPGVGKSDTIKQAACEIYGTDKLDAVYRDIRVSDKDPVEIGGLQFIQEGVTKRTRPDWWPTSGSGLLVLEELTAAPKMIQAVCYGIVLDRQLGEYRLPDGWSVVATGNKLEDRAIVQHMSTALNSRFFHIDFDVDVEDWITWALNAGVKTELIAFIRFASRLLHDFHPDSADRSFPCPRTWEYVSDILKTGINGGVQYDLLKGCVGEGAASEFLAFYKICNKLPTIDSILVDPGKADVPDDPATLYALCGALSAKMHQNNVDRACQYLERLPDEFSVLTMRDALRRDFKLATTRAYIEWNSKHADIV